MNCVSMNTFELGEAWRLCYYLFIFFLTPVSQIRM